jgi:DDE superfamily endonuclease
VGDVVLLYADQSEALTHPYLAHAWAPRGADLRIAAPGQSRKVAMMGALDAASRELIVHTSQTKRSSDFIALLEKLDRRFGPQPGPTRKPVVLALDNGPVHNQQGERRGSGGAPLDHCRAAASIRAGTQRHRTELARPQAPPPRPSPLPRRRRSRGHGSCRGFGTQPRETTPPSV